MFNIFHCFQGATQVSENPQYRFFSPSRKTHDMKPSSRLICTAQGNFADACLAVHNYNQKHESKWLYIFQKRGIFLFFFFLLSKAACSQGLVVSVWWCNAVTVLLQSSRKASATVFRPTLTSYKDTYTTQWQQRGHRCLSGPLRGDELEGWGEEMSCISYEI